MLQRLVKLKEEMKLCLTEGNPKLSDLFHNEICLLNLAYLTDNREKLGGLNTFLQVEKEIYCSQNYWVFWTFPSSDILETRKHDVSETGSVSVLR
jgi:hypothetical protein